MPGDAVLEWFDSHCHLQDEFDRPDDGPVEPHADRLAGAIARASEAGVTRLVCVGTGADSSAEAVHLARSLRRPGGPAAAEGVSLWATVGLHPHDAVDGVDGLDGLLAAELGGDAPDRVVVGIGECGLDYHYDHSPRPVQREAFALQIELAHRHGLALVIHCFTGGPDEARRCLGLGAALSFSGVVTFKNAAEVREAVALCPLDRLLVETDSPFLTPVPHRGTPNEPSRVPLVGAAVAKVKGLEAAEVAEASTANARRAFRV